jgi:hypothetical protein
MPTTCLFFRSFVDRLVPKVANNCSTKNDGYGAVAAVCETQNGFHFLPLMLALLQ